MKIIINLDIEAIVVQAIQDHIKSNLVINNTPANNPVSDTSTKVVDTSQEEISITVSTDTQQSAESTTEKEDSIPPLDTDIPAEESTTDSSESKYEYAPTAGRRRNKEEMVLHDHELKLGRKLTAAEKGEVRAQFEIYEEDADKAKEDAKKRIEAERTTERVLAQVAEEARTGNPVEEDSSDNFLVSEPSSEPETETASTTEETKTSDTLFDEPESKEAQTPKADELTNLDSLFS